MLFALVPVTLGTIVTAFVVLIVVGVCLYLVEHYVPMAAPIKLVLRVVVVLLLVLWLLSFFGMY